MLTEYRDGILFCLVPEAAFDNIVQGAQVIGSTEGGVSWRKGNSLLSMTNAGSGWEYSVCPNYFLMVQA